MRVGDPLDALALERVARAGRRAASARRRARTSSISPASRNAPARCGPPSSSSAVGCRARRAGRARSARARARSRRSRRSPRRPPSRALRRRCAARRARRRRSAAPRRRRATSCESSGRRAVESKTTRRGWRCDAVDARGQPRVVRERGADPDADRVDLGAPAVGELAAASQEIHCESPARVATLPSSLIADLKSTHGRPVRACLRNAWFSAARGAASSPSATPPRRPRRAGCPSPRPLAFSLGSSQATTTRRDARATIASVHGGCLPWWQQGSSET